MVGRGGDNQVRQKSEDGLGARLHQPPPDKILMYIHLINKIPTFFCLHRPAADTKASEETQQKKTKTKTSYLFCNFCIVEILIITSKIYYALSTQ